MIKLEAGNVLLKPSSRRQLMGWLRRPARIGQRLGNFDLTITLSRSGNQLEAVAAVRDKAGMFTCRSRQRDVRYAMRELIRRVNMQLHLQSLQHLAEAA
jgi:hypothetical protein